MKDVKIPELEYEEYSSSSELRLHIAVILMFICIVLFLFFRIVYE